MKLLTDELRLLLPPLRTQDGSANPTVHLLCPAEHKACAIGELDDSCE